MRIVTIDIAFLVRNILDVLFAVLLFRRLKTDRSNDTLGIVLRVLSLAGIVALNTIALVPGTPRYVLVGEAYIRETVRLLLMGVYLMGLRRDSTVRVLYKSMYWLILYNSYSMISRLVSDYFIKDQSFFSLFYRLACMAALLTLSYLVVDYSGMMNIRPSRFIQISVNAVCLVYISAEYRFVSRLMSRSFTLRYFILMLLIFFPVSLLLAEHSSSAQQELAEIKLRETADEYRMQYYDNVKKSDENIRTLAHDMKNHLIAIRHMARDSENDKIESYIDSMYENFGLSGGRVKTGSDLIDSIIMKKIGDSERLDIQYSVLLDAHLLDNISDIDICTIFGNTLDNAVEACEKVKDSENRFISIRSGVSANNAVIEISNSCRRKPLIENGLPVTSKADKENHGIGMKSIKRAVEKYGGMMRVDAASNSVYKLTMMFPLAN